MSKEKFYQWVLPDFNLEMKRTSYTCVEPLPSDWMYLGYAITQLVRRPSDIQDVIEQGPKRVGQFRHVHSLDWRTPYYTRVHDMLPEMLTSHVLVVHWIGKRRLARRLRLRPSTIVLLSVVGAPTMIISLPPAPLVCIGNIHPDDVIITTQKRKFHVPKPEQAQRK